MSDGENKPTRNNQNFPCAQINSPKIELNLHLRKSVDAQNILTKINLSENSSPKDIQNVKDLVAKMWAEPKLAKTGPP